MSASGWDGVTISFATPDLGMCGLIRHGLALVFVDGVPRVLLADELKAQELQTAETSDGWEISGAGIEVTVVPHAPVASSPGSVGGLAVAEQPVHVHGVVSHEGARLPVEALGQRSHVTGSPDWDRLAAIRTASVWLDSGHGSTVVSARFAGTNGHERDDIWGAVWADGEPEPVDDPRLSTTYDGDGHQRRAGLELWRGEAYTEDAHSHRAAGHAVCGSTVEVGQLRIDCAFMRWTADGATGVGRYDLIRPRGA